MLRHDLQLYRVIVKELSSVCLSFTAFNQVEQHLTTFTVTTTQIIFLLKDNVSI